MGYIKCLEYGIDVFTSCVDFNAPIGKWDTSNVLTTYGMFQDCMTFNQPIGEWNLERVEKTTNMFLNAMHFNQNLNNWKLPNIKTKKQMFFGCSSLEEKNIENIISYKIVHNYF